MYAFRVHEDVDGTLESVLRQGFVAQLPDPASFDLASHLLNATTSNWINEHVAQYKNSYFGPWSPYVSTSLSFLWSLWAVNKGVFHGCKSLLYLLNIPQPNYPTQGSAQVGEAVWRTGGNVIDISTTGIAFATAAKEVLVTHQIGPELIVGYFDMAPHLQLLRKLLPELKKPASQIFFRALDNLRGKDHCTFFKRLQATVDLFLHNFLIPPRTRAVKITQNQQRDWLLVDRDRLSFGNSIYALGFKDIDGRRKAEDKSVKDSMSIRFSYAKILRLLRLKGANEYVG